MKVNQCLKKEKKKDETAHLVRVHISEKKNINYVLLLQKSEN